MKKNIVLFISGLMVIFTVFFVLKINENGKISKYIENGKANFTQKENIKEKNKGIGKSSTHTKPTPTKLDVKMNKNYVRMQKHFLCDIGKIGDTFSSLGYSIQVKNIEFSKKFKSGLIYPYWNVEEAKQDKNGNILDKHRYAYCYISVDNVRSELNNEFCCGNIYLYALNSKQQVINSKEISTCDNKNFTNPNNDLIYFIKKGKKRKIRIAYILNQQMQKAAYLVLQFKLDGSGRPSKSDYVIIVKEKKWNE
jgi:hypothetical protein